VNLYALLGIVGDHEQNIQNNKNFFEMINGFCQQHNCSFHDLLHMVNLIDANYKIGEKQAVEDAPHFLLTLHDPRDILTNKHWNHNLAKLNNEIIRQLEKPAEEKHNILIKTIDTPCNIISTITRRISWDSGKDAVVINTGFFPDFDQIYVRSKKNVQPLIERGKNLGFRAGGKQEVLGAIVPKDKTESFLQEIIMFLTTDPKNRGGKV